MRSFYFSGAAVHVSTQSGQLVLHRIGRVMMTGPAFTALGT